MLNDVLSDYCATAIFAVNPQSETIVAANPACELLLGYTQTQLIGMPISQIEVGLQDVFFWEDIRQLGAQEIFQVEGEYRHSHGHLLPISKTIRVVTQDAQTLCIISAHDIGANKRLEEESARTSSLLAATLESTVDGILVTDLNGNIVNFNHRLSQMWQWDIHTDDSLELLLADFIANLQESAIFEQWLAELQHDPYLEDSLTCTLQDGRVFELVSRPQQYRAEPIGRLFCVHDISALKASEAALCIARDQAQAANQAKSDFLAHMSHELRTPLNAILGFAQMIEGDQGSPHQASGAYIHKAGRHLLELINEVLDLASIEAGKLQLRNEIVDLNATIADCVELTQFLAAAKQVTLNIAPTNTAALVHGDTRRVRQMLLNLISNAIKYNREQGHVHITITAAAPSFWRLSVNDTGIGIAEQDQWQLFTAFNRVGSAQTRVEGTGIGLAFTRKLAHLMHGEVGMSSQLNVGSQFWLDLPQALAQSQPASVASEPDSQTRTLLYIEDDLLSQKLIENIIAKQRPQYQLHIAGTGEQGIALALQLKPDLILLDQHLPDATGPMIFEQLLQHVSTAKIPCLALSGNSLPDEINEGLRMGFSAYLSKPIQISQTLLTIDQILSKSNTPSK